MGFLWYIMKLQLTHIEGNVDFVTMSIVPQTTSKTIIDHIATRKMQQNTLLFSLQSSNWRMNERETLAECRQLEKMGNL